ncbi:right-handed parallel beta-helix repeat-containing protein [Paenibacillus sp. GYB003]|uniref:right-handed parallel beta-helix repeat-containing protein n=1 Tax=Paenibacillus sp. GYB003 TaxID=2994392 RepID=UPI002F96740F
MPDRDESKERGAVSRRTVLSALGAAGTALLAGGWLGSAVKQAQAAQSVTDVVYGNDNALLKKHKDDSGVSVFNVKDFGAHGNGAADDAQAIQAALDYAYSAGGGTVYVPDGVYPIQSTLSIFSHTRLVLSSKATIRRDSTAVKPMLMNGRRGQDTGAGFTGHGDIEICGGTWDGNSAAYPTQFPHMSFAHAERLIIRDTRIIRNVNDHHIEINSTNGCQIRNVWFEGYLRTSREAEAVQIDLATKESFPHFGPWDNTPCNNVLIDGCTFMECCRGVGSHSSLEGYNHSHIRITNCHFENISDNAIFARNYDQLVVAGNTFYECVSGIDVSSRSGKTYNVTIADNVLKNIRPKSDWGAIRVYTPTDMAKAGGRICNIVISGNVIENVFGPVGIHANQISRLTIGGNIVRNVGEGGTGRGIYVGYGQEGVVIRGNQVSLCTERGIAVANSGGPVGIAGNVVSETASHGIHMDNCRNVACDGNTVSNAGRGGIGNGIYVLSIRDSQVTNNIVTNCAENGINVKNGADCSIKHNLLTGVPLKISTNNQRHAVEGNTIRRGDRSMAEGIVVAASAEAVLLAGNDLRLSGTSAAIVDDGTGTIISVQAERTADSTELSCNGTGLIVNGNANTSSSEERVCVSPLFVGLYDETIGSAAKTSASE